MLAFAAAAGCASRGGDDGEPLRPGPAGADTVDGIEYRGELFVMESFPVQLAATVTVTNEASEARSLEFPDGCVVLLRAYRGSDLAWDQSRTVACTLAIETVTFEPGQSREFRAPHASAYDVLGDSLPDGVYRFTAYLRPDGRTVEVPLGETDLAIPRN